MTITDKKEIKIAFVAGLSDKKIVQFLEPFNAIESVQTVHLYRRRHLPSFGKVISFPMGKWARKRKHLGELVRFFHLLCNTHKYDVLIGCFQRFHGFWAFLAGRLLNRPVIQLIITDIKWNHERPLYRLPMMHANACGVMGEHSKMQLSKDFLGEIQVITLPFSMPDRIWIDQKKEWDIIAVGDFAIEKDYPWMMRVLAKLKKEYPNFTIALLGNGHEEKLEYFLDQSELRNNFVFPGHLHHKDLDEAYARSRMLLMTSRWEGLPMVAVEAMTFGLPIIATTVGDIPWLVRDGVEGKLVPHGQTEKMVGALLEMLTDRKTCKAMGETARQRIEELYPKFENMHIAKQWNKLLYSALDDNKNKPS